jgi:alpha-ketoglutarate-dependent taurine dioxygenase
MPFVESDVLLEVIFCHMEQLRFIHEHVWWAGDPLIWGNFCTMHARTYLDPAECRVLRRVTVRGSQLKAAAV